MIKAEQRRCLKLAIYLGASAKLREATVNFVVSVCLSALNKLCSPRENFCEILYVGVSFVKIFRQN